MAPSKRSESAIFVFWGGDGGGETGDRTKEYNLSFAGKKK